MFVAGAAIFAVAWNSPYFQNHSTQWRETIIQQIGSMIISSPIRLVFGYGDQATARRAAKAAFPGVMNPHNLLVEIVIAYGVFGCPGVSRRSGLDAGPGASCAEWYLATRSAARPSDHARPRRIRSCPQFLRGYGYAPCSSSLARARYGSSVRFSDPAPMCSGIPCQPKRFLRPQRNFGDGSRAAARVFSSVVK